MIQMNELDLSPYKVSAAFFLNSLYNRNEDVENYLTSTGKLLWKKNRDSVRAYFTERLGEDFNKLCIANGEDFIERVNEKSIVLLAGVRDERDLEIEVGKVRAKGIRIPMIKQKNIWYFDLEKFIDGNY